MCYDFKACEMRRGSVRLGVRRAMASAFIYPPTAFPCRNGELGLCRDMFKVDFSSGNGPWEKDIAKSSMLVSRVGRWMFRSIGIVWSLESLRVVSRGLGGFCLVCELQWP